MGPNPCLEGTWLQISYRRCCLRRYGWIHRAWAKIGQGPSKRKRPMAKQAPLLWRGDISLSYWQITYTDTSISITCWNTWSQVMLVSTSLLPSLFTIFMHVYCMRNDPCFVDECCQDRGRKVAWQQRNVRRGPLVILAMCLTRWPPWPPGDKLVYKPFWQ